MACKYDKNKNEIWKYGQYRYKSVHRSKSAINILIQDYEFVLRVKGKAIPVPVRGGPNGCETSMLPHFLDNRLTDVGEVVSLTLRPTFTPRKIPGTHIC
jgi:hypothetical protein